MSLYIIVCASCWFYKMDYILLYGVNNVKIIRSISIYQIQLSAGVSYS
jgi:hypothetical protein